MKTSASAIQTVCDGCNKKCDTDERFDSLQHVISVSAFSVMSASSHSSPNLSLSRPPPDGVRPERSQSHLVWLVLDSPLCLHPNSARLVAASISLHNLSLTLVTGEPEGAGSHPSTTTCRRNILIRSSALQILIRSRLCLSTGLASACAAAHGQTALAMSCQAQKGERTAPHGSRLLPMKYSKRTHCTLYQQLRSF